MKKAISASIALLACLHAHSAVIIDITETGGGVEYTITGSLDVTGLFAQLNQTGFDGDGIFNGNAVVSHIPTGSTYDVYSSFFTSTPADFGDEFGGGISGPGVSGDIFHIQGNTPISPLIIVPAGYALAPYSFNITRSFPGATFADGGFISGSSYSWIWPADSVTVNFNTSSVIPEPSTWIALTGLASLGAFVFVRRRKRLQAAAAQQQ